jgi:hypothetical protein
MQISRLFDEYWIHETCLETQTITLVMLLTTLARLFEHFCQHRFRSITCYAASKTFLSRFFLAVMMEALLLPSYART